MAGPNDAEKSLLDTQKLATSFASRMLDKLYDAAEAKLRSEWARKRNEQLKGLSRLVESQTTNYRKIKNILYYNEAVDLESLYVPLSFTADRYAVFRTDSKNELVSEEQVFARLLAPMRIVLCATAGAGKSFFMRRALLRLSTHDADRVPIFYELRNLNDKPKGELIAHVIEHLTLTSKGLMPEQIRLGLEKGSFILLLDGYDEIEPDKIEHYQSELITLALSYPLAPVMVSSRPIDAMLSWQNYTSYHIAPLSKEGVVELLRKLAFDEIVKSKFIDYVKADLYEKHRSFLSIPLLVTMMLITFSETAEIDSKLTNFYADAFSALFVRHDAKKEAFRRKLLSGLSRDELERLFAAFCLLTYSDNKYQFTEADALTSIEKSAEVQDIEVNRGAAFQDFRITACMLVKDGRSYVFSHRSFQEYFAAVFIDSCSQDLAVKLLQSVSGRANRDNVLRLLLELNPELVEKHWVLPRLKKINEAISRFTSANMSAGFASTFFEILLDRPRREGPGESRDGLVVSFGLKGKMGLNLFIISRLYQFDVFGAVGEDLIKYADERAKSSEKADKKIRGQHALFRFAIHIDRHSDLELPGVMALVKRLQQLQDKISTSYDNKRLRLESALLGTTARRKNQMICQPGGLIPSESLGYDDASNVAAGTPDDPGRGRAHGVQHWICRPRPHSLPRGA